MSLSVYVAMNECKLKQVHFRVKPSEGHPIGGLLNPRIMHILALQLLLIRRLPFQLWISSVSLSSRELEIPERPIRPGISSYYCCLNASFNYPQAALLSNYCQNLPHRFFTNFVPDYLDQWALKDPGKDKHSSLRGWEKGVHFQTDKKSL